MFESTLWYINGGVTSYRTTSQQQQLDLRLMDRLNELVMGGSPGLVVTGGDSSAIGRGFESRHHILDGHDFFTLISYKNCIVCLKRPKINKKGQGWPI